MNPYRFLDDNTIEVEKMPEKKFKYKVAINGDEMSLTDEKGVTKKLMRIK